MHFYKKQLLLLFALCSVLIPAKAQFQDIYNYAPGWNIPFQGGEIEDVITINPGGDGIPGTGVLGGNQLAAVGTDNSVNPPMGLLSWYDDLGNKILYRYITNLGTPRSVEGVDLCEAAWTNDQQVALFRDDNRAVIFYINKIGYIRNNTRAINNFDPEAIISANTASGSGVFVLGVDNSTQVNRLAVCAMNTTGGTNWSYTYDLVNSASIPLQNVRGLDIEYLGTQGFVVVGSALDPGVNRECAFVLNLNEDGTVMADDPVAGIKGLHIYHNDLSGNPLWLSAETVAPTRANPPQPTEVIMSGHYKTTQGGNELMYVLRLNPFTGKRVWDLVPKSGDPFFNGLYKVEDIDYNGGEYYQLSGYIENTRERGFTYHFDNNGGSIGLYEYDGSTVASQNSRLKGNHYDPVRGRFVVGGSYDNTISLPVTPLDPSNWLIGTQGFTNGNALNCTDSDDPSILIPEIDRVDGLADEVIGTNASQASMRYRSGPSTEQPQCVTPKNGGSLEMVLENAGINVSHQNDLQEFSIRINGEVDGPLALRVQNIQGQVLWQGEMTDQEKTISSQSFAEGVYFVTWELPNGVSETTKIALIK